MVEDLDEDLYDNNEDWDAPNTLECGCEWEYVGGKIIWCLCEEHDEQEHYVPQKPLLKKFRKQDND